MKELPTVEITTRRFASGNHIRTLPKAIAYAYRKRRFQRFYKQGVRQAAASLLGCAVKDVQHHAKMEVYYCRESQAVHDQDLGEVLTKIKRRRY